MSLEKKLEQLRIEWREQPENRAKIELQVKVLKLGQRYPKNRPQLSQMVKEELF